MNSIYLRVSEANESGTTNLVEIVAHQGIVQKRLHRERRVCLGELGSKTTLTLPLCRNVQEPSDSGCRHGLSQVSAMLGAKSSRTECRQEDLLSDKSEFRSPQVLH